MHTLTEPGGRVLIYTYSYRVIHKCVPYLTGVKGEQIIKTNKRTTFFTPENTKSIAPTSKMCRIIFQKLSIAIYFISLQETKLLKHLFTHI